MYAIPRPIVVFLLAILGSLPAYAGDPVAITAVPVSDGITMLTGRGGNVAVSIGADGVLVIDDQYTEQYAPIVEAIGQLTSQPIKFVLNTHWHNDHTGSNEQMARSGAVIVAHANVRTRLASDQVMAFFKRTQPASPPAALPVLTFTHDITFQLNGEALEIVHVAHAHTDGDAVVYFKRANVIHTGDVFFNGLYPFIDVGSGGSVKGVLAAVDQILARADDHTRIIPGHGPLGDRKALLAYREMLDSVHNQIATMMVANHSLDQIIAARPTAAFDALWGNGFLTPETFVRLIHDAITRATLD